MVNPGVQTLVRRARQLAKVNGHRLERMRTYSNEISRTVSKDAACIDCGAVAWVDPRDPKQMGGHAITDTCPNRH